MTARLRPETDRRRSFQPGMERVEARVLLTDFTVSNTSDSAGDTGSLPYALSHATTNDRILFAIPTSDPNYHAATGSWTIPIASSLPTISRGILVDGLSQQSQPGASTAHPAIELTPSAGFAGDGLDLDLGGSSSGSAGGATISGLAIDGFRGAGIFVGSGAGSNLVTGNFIGTDVTGTASRPNAGGGIYISSSFGNTIGGPTTAERNVISGNGGAGIVLNGSDNLVEGNFIGLNAAGTGGVPNAGDGISILSGFFNTVGGTATGAGNTIAFNAGIGVAVDTGTGNAILSNSITDNVGGGIVLTNGGNNDQAAPLLTDALAYQDRTVVDGSLAVQAGTGYLIQLFSNDPASGQGRTLIGSRAIGSRGSAGTVPFTFTNSTALPLGSTITAIASVTSTPSESSNPQTGDTSAFSGAATVVSPFIVTNTTDAGIGSLRFAVQAANADTANDDTITFRIPTDDPGYIAATQSWTIPIFSGLTISKPASQGGQHTVFIDALSQQSQPGATTAHPVIVVTPGSEFSGSFGLRISSGGNTVGGLVINGFPGDAVTIGGSGASNNLVTGCFIGTDPLGITAVSNGGAGVRLNSPANTVADNVISASHSEGIFVTAGGDLIQGNRIGTNAAGTAAFGNGLSGITLQQSSGNTIRGNVVSGNGVRPIGGLGIDLVGSQAQGNLLQGNLIGTDATGTRALPNMSGGVLISGANNTVGGTAAGAGNVISGNGVDGVGIAPETASGNQILGNLIGTDASGTAALGNSLDGIALQANGTIIRGNVISGNGTGPAGGKGIVMRGSGAQGNLVQGNFIGTNAAGTAALPNLGDGVAITGPNNTIGGTAAGDRNIISGNRDHGLSITGASGNTIAGNTIGAGAGGETALGNGLDGIILNNAPNNAITGNLISGNGVGHDAAGINVTGASSTGNVMSGNRIGTNAEGTTSLGNSLQGIFIGNGASNNTVGPGNVISGNGNGSSASSGLAISGSGAQGNLVRGNFIGTNASGMAPLPNLGDGVSISGPNNTIGGTATGDRNIISGNRDHGLSITGASGNAITGNTIGVGVDGTTAVGNGLDGIFLDNAPNNAMTGNLISGNGVGQDAAGINVTGSGSTGNVMSDNRIGTNAAGTAALGNSFHGIFLGDGASRNTIGPGNLVSGNGSANVQGVAVYLSGATTTGNQVVGNQIGTDVTGMARLTETVIGVLISGSPGNTVQGNLISGHRFIGVEIAGASASGNQVLDNRIGTNATGTRAITNGSDGVFINNAPNNTIGGTAAGASNLISGNGSVGIQLFGAQSQGNVVEGNRIGLDSAGRPTLLNRDGGIFVNTGPQANQIGGTGPGQANRGQKRPTFSLSGFHQAHRAVRLQAKGHAGRQSVRPHLGSRPHLRRRPH